MTVFILLMAILLQRKDIPMMILQTKKRTITNNISAVNLMLIPIFLKKGPYLPILTPILPQKDWMRMEILLLRKIIVMKVTVLGEITLRISP